MLRSHTIHGCHLAICLFLHGVVMSAGQVVALFGGKEVKIHDGKPSLITPMVCLVRYGDGRIGYRDVLKPTNSSIKIVRSDLSLDEEKRLIKDEYNIAVKFDVKNRFNFKKSGILFKHTVLHFDGKKVLIKGKHVSVIREAYVLGDYILAAIHECGEKANDGPVDILCIDIITMKAQFIPCGSKIYWPLKLIKVDD